MESEGIGGNCAEFPSTSMKDSILTIPILPAEFITEILLRVPVKPLLKFRRVSKSWLALIYSPEFIKTHIRISANNKYYTHHRLMLRSKCILKDCSLMSVLSESVMEVSRLNYPVTNQHKTFWTVVGSVNGLICLSKGANVDLANEKWEKVEQPCCEEEGVLVLGVLGNNLSVIISRFINGFGYDELHDDYKVMRCTYYSSDVEVQIYCLKSDAWRSIHYLQDGVSFSCPSKFVNGKLYWANYTDRSFYKSRYIISINLVDWEKVEQPSYRGDYNLQLGLLSSELSVYINKEKHAYVWVMKKSWTKLFTVKYADNPDSFAVPFFMSNKGEIVVGFASTFMIYNPKDNSLRPAIMNSDDWWYTEIYVESLVSPFSTGGTSDATKTQAEKVQVKTIK
ncbi:hypothetical protein K7X08_010692 [Anisodus acutangulus]|uniref:F-box domain-containing protein n=1 Tax=Anisodus acutangulus TaxID=402998 RepID=A0A9Q1M0S7_9SOLA|nr:hypothetical protein K7X08_010692 [Anisodus acutangulus]